MHKLRKWVVEKVIEDIKNKFDNEKVTIGILGLAYKPNIDDLRESPALEIAIKLKNKGYDLIACEPNSDKNEIDGILNFRLEDLIDKADYFVYAVAHNQFINGKQLINSKPCFDTVGVCR